MLDYGLAVSFWFVGEWPIAVIWILMQAYSMIEAENEPYAIVIIFGFVLVKKIYKIGW